LDSKLNSGLQLTSQAVSKLDAKLEGGMTAMSETITKLDGKLDGNMQTTNQAIGDLYREKLSVQEFREFVNVFNKILSKSFPLPEKPVTQLSEAVTRESAAEVSSFYQEKPVAVLETESNAPQNTETASLSQTVEEVTPQIIVENPSSEADEKVTFPQDIEKTASSPEAPVGGEVNKHVGFPMNVVGESFYRGGCGDTSWNDCG
jgi:hypothetical protein